MGPAESGLQGLAQRQLVVSCVWDEAPGVPDHVWLAVRHFAFLQPHDLASLHVNSCPVTPGWSRCSPVGAPLLTLSAAQGSPGQPSRPLPVPTPAWLNDPLQVGVRQVCISEQLPLVQNQ